MVFTRKHLILDHKIKGQELVNDEMQYTYIDTKLNYTDRMYQQIKIGSRSMIAGRTTERWGWVSNLLLT